jgi:hypothetical protein
LFGVCLFLGVPNSRQKKKREKGRARKKMEGTNGPDPLSVCPKLDAEGKLTGF